ncbi:hypothetical protein CK203_057126 [Vitis vinifera]|uniref:Large ribosomal subunit protein bL25 beta domain-containing protein n=1 Tax=Vitis vinifera TaxID=29760 RepID=A0A438GDA1_VITVI|nr:hypothetical protein CK203_057126 [Vitis vinifera]
MLGCVVEAHGPWFKSCCWFNSLIYLVLVVASVVSALRFGYSCRVLTACPWKYMFALCFDRAYLNTIKRTVKYLCPADIIPPYIDVDLSELDAGQKIVMGDLKVHPALKLLRSKDEPVCKIMGTRVSDQRKSK